MARHPSSRPQYFFGTLSAAFLAKALGIPKVSTVELGVAGGNGLLELERIGRELSAITGVEIEVYGFDSGTGLPKPQDYRDLPQMWKEGYYGMDVDRLRGRLTKAKLILGPVSETVPAFLGGTIAPLGFVAFDLDIYSSTRDALRLFDAPTSKLLPRVHCYFDDIIGFSHGDHNGERLAIDEFNADHDVRKLSKIYGLRYVLELDQVWTEMVYMLHAFDHERYSDFDGSNTMTEIPLLEP